MKIDFYYNDLQKRIVRLLHSLGVPANVRGYQYARDAIEMIHNDLDLSKNFKKNIYPLLASKYETNIYNIERNIRHAIEISSIRGDCFLLEEIFGYSIDVNRTKPTNAEFLVTLADKIRIDESNKKI